MSPELRKALYTHLQTAIEIELSTIPIYLYTYYSIQRQPQNTDNLPNGQALATFANKAGGILMSVAVEEMLHMSLSCNILRALGGEPKLYCRSPGAYPTNLPHHKAGFSVGLEPLSAHQLDQFKIIEIPEAAGAPPQRDNWTSIGQFYRYILELIDETSDEDFGHAEEQVAAHRGYYSPNNVDTVYPKDGYYLKQPENPFDPVKRGASQAQYPNNRDSGHLIRIRSKADAHRAIHSIMLEGEGYTTDPTHKRDDPEHNEVSHWYKYDQLRQEIADFSAKDLADIVMPFPVNPTRASYPAQFLPLVDLANAVYSYLFLLTETAYRHKGDVQESIFYIGMHKGMIFILDKILGGMRYLSLNNPAGNVLAPTFENYSFTSLATAKQELINLCMAVPASLGLDSNILGRIQDLPDVNIGPDGIVRF
ncbi:ferritin-like domain-containing protein [Andreprevotia chitinilytica]|uniref:ferritin-like domain-containing protein n=1 Tax=Andreprevotia chitinilytica TaxID=396808 RepID=UPI000553A28C|nr:ferritin-like protein [Andreprevotia chitinilytica]